MMRDPKILLLDEATSALDSRSERLIQKALQDASKGRTTISIVHRLSTVKDADHIIVMRSGRVIEQGSHYELIAADGDYASMVRLQNVSQHDDKATEPTSGDVVDDAVSSTTRSGDTIKGSTDEKADIVSTDKAKLEKGRDIKPEQDKEPAKRGIWSTLRGMGTLTRAQAIYLLVAFTASAIVGGSYSGEAVIFGHTVSSFSACRTAEQILSSGRFWGLLFFVLAIIEFFANLLMGSFFGLVSENTLFKIRVLSFRTLLGQDVDWHESGGRDASSLLSYITTDANALAGLTGTILGTLFSILINTVAGIALSLAIAWRIAVVLLACIP